MCKVAVYILQGRVFFDISKLSWLVHFFKLPFEVYQCGHCVKQDTLSFIISIKDCRTLKVQILPKLLY